MSYGEPNSQAELTEAKAYARSRAAMRRADAHRADAQNAKLPTTTTRPIVAEQQGGDPIWKTMDSAPKEPGVEIIAARFGIYAELTAMCEKSPFISFWMQSRQKFYGEPTHWLCKVPASFPPVRS